MQPVEFCAVDGCFEVRTRGPRSRVYCRGHYRSEVLAKAEDLFTCEVLASLGTRGELAAVTDAVTGEDVYHGGTVVLDPAETNVAALVAGGIVRVLHLGPKKVTTVKKVKA